MALLAGTVYDPAAVVSKATTSALAMTALDTTNLRLSFTCPANGSVLVRLACTVGGASSSPQILLGILDGATVRGRTVPMGSWPSGIATTGITWESVFVVSGLTPTNVYTWDAAYGVEKVQSSTGIKYGGPNDATGADAWGGFAYEIWSTPTLLGSVLYDPGTAASYALTSLKALTAFDTTNARITFTAPASGNVFWRIRAPYVPLGNTTAGFHLLGILDGATVRGREAPVKTVDSQASSNVLCPHDASGVVTGLSGSYTWDAAYAVQVVAGAGAFQCGGPNDTTATNAWGGLQYEIWAA